jgi:Ca-activated chloride channel homolog
MYAIPQKKGRLIMTLTTYSQLWWALLLIPIIYLIATTLVNRKSWLRNSAAGLRVMAIIFLALALCRPFFESSSKDIHAVFLIDVSQSIDLESVKSATDAIEKSLTLLKPNDSHGIYIFANGIQKTTLKKLRKTIKDWDEKVSDDVFRSKSAIAASLESLKMVFPANKAKKLTLFSDGVETEGSLTAVLKNFENENIALSFSALKKLQKPEVSVVSMTASSPVAYKGEVVKMKATLLSNYKTTATVKFISQGVIVFKKEVELAKNINKDVFFEVTTNEITSGIWETEVSSKEDYFPINNKARCSLLMQGEAKLLALHRTPTKLREFKRALDKQGVSVDLRGKFGLPASLQALTEFDAIMLADIEATNLTARQMDNIRKYVTDFGGGLIMTGSENSFGLGGYYKTPVEEVLPVTSRYEKEKEQPSLAMVLVIDKSGSMQGAPIALAREASKAAVELLSVRDQVGVVAFDGQAKIISDMTSAANKSEVLSQIDSVGAGGGTNMYPAMATAKDMLGTASAKIKHMIVLSDGQSQGGDFEGIASELAENGVTISTVSLGNGAAVDLMAAIAQIGNGRAYVTNNAEEMPRIFTKETMEASRSAIKEEPFIPIKVDDSDSLQGINIDESPLLLGYVMTKVKPTAKVQLLTESGDPLMASGRYGLGQSIAFTSDVTEQWAGEWLEWNNFGKFWAQAIRSIIRNKSNNGFTTKLEKSGNEMHLEIYRSDERSNPENRIEWDAILMDNNGMQKRLNFDEVGFGNYSVKFPVPDANSYAIRLNDKTNNRLKTISKIKSYPKEYLLSSKRPAILDQLPLFTEEQFTEKRLEVKTQNSALNVFALIAMLCLITSTIFRRI